MILAHPAYRKQNISMDLQRWRHSLGEPAVQRRSPDQHRRAMRLSVLAGDKGPEFSPSLLSSAFTDIPFPAYLPTQEIPNCNGKRKASVPNRSKGT